MTSRARISPVRRSTLGEDVYEAIKTLVMEHTLTPGDRVNIDALARELEVSQTPIREALARLESDGLVRKRALVGYTVSPLLTEQELIAMFDLRLLLEGASARWAAERADDATRDAIVAESKLAAPLDGPNPDDRGSYAAFTALDARFHDLVASAADNPLLRESITRLHAHLHLHRLYFPYAQSGATGDEHRRISAAIRAADPDAAEKAMHAHLIEARKRHLVAFE